MKKLFTFAILCLSITLVSCKKQSLQSYLIETQENEDYVRFDFSTSMLSTFLENISEEQKEVFNSVKKINIAFLSNEKAEKEEITIERNKLKQVMKNTDYKELIRMNDKGKGKATIYYSGEADAIDEIIAVVYAKDFGFGVARLLGDNMNPAKIIDMLQKADMKDKGSELEKIKDIFGGQFQTENIRVEPVQ